jgi:hypothetical protein
MVSNRLKLERFRTLVIDHSANGHRAALRIDRKTNKGRFNLDYTIMAQLTRQYDNPSEFRAPGDRPWMVKFAGERGIDLGGPGRDLVTVAAEDFVLPASGLVVAVPNAREKIGDHQDCVIPIPARNAINPIAQYKVAGVLIGICIRSGLVQPFPFPPFVWQFLAGEELRISMIFTIDERYHSFIQTLTSAIESRMDEAEFSRKFALNFTVTNSLNEEVPLTARGRIEPVTLGNCPQYIELANEFKLKELLPYLMAMRDGLRENLQVEPSPAIDWKTIRFAACGDQDISLDLLKSVTRFEGLSVEQITMFWKVVASFTPAQKSKLLKFATGRARLPPQIAESESFLKVDGMAAVDLMPEASTCSQTLHFPAYTSFERAKEMVLLATNFGGFFELN